MGIQVCHVSEASRELGIGAREVKAAVEPLITVQYASWVELDQSFKLEKWPSPPS